MGSWMLGTCVGMLLCAAVGVSLPRLAFGFVFSTVICCIVEILRNTK